MEKGFVNLSHLHEHGENVVEYIKVQLFHCNDLLQDWLFLFNIDESQEDFLVEINCCLSERYITKVFSNT